jgi:hypothetical protein
VTTVTATLAGALLIAVPLALNAAFALLAARFDYPDVLRRPTGEVLAAFRAGGTSLVLLWWAFALTAVLLAPLVVLLSSALPDADGTVLTLATTVGVGGHERAGWPLAARLTPVAYVAWSLRLAATGVALLV